GAEAIKKAYALLIALALGGLVGWLRSYSTLTEQLRNSGRPQAWLEKVQSFLVIPDALALPHWLNPIARGQMAGFAFEPSVLLIGAGMIAGLRVCLSMLLGSALLYFVVAPRLLAADLAHAGLPGYVPSFTVNPAGNFSPTRWAVWGGTAVMVFSSLTVLALQWQTLARAFTIFKKRKGPTQLNPIDAVEVPISWLVAG